MSSGDDKRAIERFVAGLEVEEDALAAAVSARAVDRTIVVEALLTALASPQAGMRRRAADRVARMDEVAPRIEAQLTLIALEDPDERAREAGIAALDAHGLPIPSLVGTPESRGERDPRPIGERLLASLWLRPMTMRSAQATLIFVARNRADAAQTRGSLIVDEDGGLMIVLTGLPAAFAGTHPAVRVRRDADSDAYTVIATAAEPVSSGGGVTIRIDPEVGSEDEVRRWLGREIELVATEG